MLRSANLQVDSRRRACATLSVACSVCVTLLGGIAGCGWLSGVEVLKRLHPSGSPMVFNTSVLLVAVGAALFLVQERWYHRSRLWVVRSIAALVGAVAVLTIGEYVFRVDLGIDQILLSGQIDVAPHPPGRMSTISAVSFLNSGIALWLLTIGGDRPARMTHLVATIGISISLFSFVGYLYSIIPFIQIPGSKAIALPSALAFSLAFLGIHVARPSSGSLDAVLSEKAGAAIVRRFILMVIAIPLLLGGLVSIALQIGLIDPFDAIILLVVLMMLAFLVLLLLNAATVLKVQGLQRAVEARYRLLFDNLADCVFIHDVDGRVTEVNEIACERLGYSRDQLVGARFDAIHTHVPASHSEGQGPMLDETHSALFESVQTAFDGRQMPVEVNSRVIEINGTRTVLSVVRDISDRKKAEAALRDTQQKLVHAQKMEAIGRLAGGIAHDFNNVICVISCCCELMIHEKLLPESLAQHVTEIAAAAERAAGLTRQLLLFSRRKPAETRVLDLNALVTCVAGMIRRIVGEDVTLRLDLAPDTPLVEADPGQLEQVLMNLVVNSRDAMPLGGEVTIATCSMNVASSIHPMCGEPFGGTYAGLTVRDCGIGMDKETKRRMFEPFFTTKGPGKGTGLGLSTVYGIVRQHGGHVDVQSEVGQGTTFAVFLPKTACSMPGAVERAPFVGPLRGDETILLVEDEIAVRRVLGKLLKSLGYGVILAGDGMEGLRVLRDCGGSVDLLISDVVMPGMSGIDLAGTVLREIPAARILLTSGHTHEDLVTQAEAIKRDPRVHFLPKPFSLANLCVKIRGILSPLPTAR